MAGVEHRYLDVSQARPVLEELLAWWAEHQDTVGGEIVYNSFPSAVQAFLHDYVGPPDAPDPRT
eukprot:5964224-Alexandrium_andersonii.AAC.1